MFPVFNAKRTLQIFKSFDCKVLLQLKLCPGLLQTAPITRRQTTNDTTTSATTTTRTATATKTKCSAYLAKCEKADNCDKCNSKSLKTFNARCLHTYFATKRGKEKKTNGGTLDEDGYATARYSVLLIDVY